MIDEPTEADVDAVAEYLGKEPPSPESIAQFAALKRLVEIARQHGNDCGLAALAGVWLGEGMAENEIIARCWPRHQRFTLVKG